MSKSIEQAKVFIEAVNKYGWQVERVDDSIVTIVKQFTPNDRDALVKCDTEYFSILCKAPLKGGSIWGTDCGGVGAIAALRSGVFRMNKSGNTGKRFLNALKKLLNI